MRGDRTATRWAALNLAIALIFGASKHLYIISLVATRLKRHQPHSIWHRRAYFAYLIAPLLAAYQRRRRRVMCAMRLLAYRRPSSSRLYYLAAAQRA